MKYAKFVSMLVFVLVAVLFNSSLAMASGRIFPAATS